MSVLYHSSNHTNLVEREVNPVVQKYYPKLLKPVHACLAVFATLSLKDRTKPLTLIFEASSGLGKTAVLQMTFPIKTAPNKSTVVEKYLYRSDKFTPKSFVTHAASIKQADLLKIDLLPKLTNKVLVTKELAPIFRGRELDLQENFSILISVLDGKGFTSDSGMRGRRGYEGRYVFNWLGATTPLPAKTHRLMSQLGTRILFYEIPSFNPTAEELFNYAKNGNPNNAEIECNIVVNNFLFKYFEKYPVGSVDVESIKFPDDILRQLVRWAEFLVKGRSAIKYDKDENEWIPIAALPSEGAWKVINYFKELAIGHALIHERKIINEVDLKFVGRVAISSIPGHLRPIVKELRKADRVDTNSCKSICMVSSPTARKYLSELSLLGIVELTKGDPITNEPDEVKLSDKYLWLKLKLQP